MLVLIAMVKLSKNNKNKNDKNKNKNTNRINSGKAVPGVRAAAKQAQKMFSAPLTSTNMGALIERSSRKGFAMSPCAAKFALAISEPFHPAARGACIPFGGMASQKVHAFTRFTFNAGSAGVGWIAITPSLANNAPCLYYTTGSYTGNNMQTLSAASTVITGIFRANHNGPYTAANITQTVGSGTPAVAGRIVVAGLKVQNISTLMNRSGVRYCFVDPSHAAINGSNANDLGAQGVVEMSAVNENACVLTAFPLTESEYSYSNTDANAAAASNTMVVYPFSNGFAGQATQYAGSTYYVDTQNSVAVGVPIGAFFVSGVTSQNAFQCEYIQHMEFTGQLAAANATRSDADADGGRKVITAGSTLVERKNNNPTAERSGWSYMYEALNDVWQETKPVLIPAALTALTAIL